MLFDVDGLKIAIGNANQKRKDMADFVVSNVDNDGLAIAINILDSTIFVPKVSIGYLEAGEVFFSPYTNDRLR